MIVILCWVLLIASIAGLIAMTAVSKKAKMDVAARIESHRERTKGTDKEQGDAFYQNFTKEEMAGKVAPPILTTACIIVMALSFIGVSFNSLFFYADPAFSYQIKTLAGNESAVIGETGFHWYGAGEVNGWKRQVTVIAGGDIVKGSASAILPVQNVMFLDQVDANAAAMARFELPTEEKGFLDMVHSYRTPLNLLNSAIIVAFEETLGATAQRMSAEDYYQGGKTEFIAMFDKDMKDGTLLVKRYEATVVTKKATKRSANAGQKKQESFGEQTKTVWKVKAILGEDGLEQRKNQSFTDFGIRCVEARVTKMKPNPQFVARMQLKQKASADRAIAREQKIQEEEQKLLAVAKGDRQVAERQAAMKVEQIQITTKAETVKKKASIERDAAKIQLETAKIVAKGVKVTADAEAYKKSAVIKADNALAQKLDAEIKIQQVWADAFAKRQVPTTVFGAGGGSGGTPTGSDSEVSNFMNIMTMEAAKRLNYDRAVTTK